MANLTPSQLEQLRALAQAEAITEAKAVTEFDLAYYNANVLGILAAQGMTGGRVKASRSGSRRMHYWLTAAGLERLKAEAAHG